MKQKLSDKLLKQLNSISAQNLFITALCIVNLILTIYLMFNGN